MNLSSALLLVLALLIPENGKAATCQDTSRTLLTVVASPESKAIVRGRSDLRVITTSSGDSDLDRLEIYVNDRQVLTVDKSELTPHGHYPHKFELKKILSVEGTGDSIPISPGLNVVTVVAWDKEQRCTYEQLYITGGSNDVYAIVIGIQKYEGVPPLSYAADDARKFQQYLIKTLGVPLGNITPLIDDKADLRAIKKAFEQLKNQSSDAATLIVFFSGHGFHSEEPGYKERTYFLPVDAEMDYPSTLLSKGELMELITDVPARQKIFFLDSCFSGTEVGAKSVTPAVASKALMRDVWKDVKGIYGIYSSAAEQASWEDPDFKHGVFTYFLLKAFNQADRDGDRYVTLAEIYQHVRPAVREHVWEKRKKIQEPREFADGVGISGFKWRILNPGGQ